MADDRPLRAEVHKLMDDLRTLRDEIRLQLHLAGMEAARAWHEELEPKLGQVERQVDAAGLQAAESLGKLAHDLKQSFEDFRGRLGSGPPEDV